ncbi:MAG: formimidoylglutamase [Chitinophagales bacterium]|nr:formimidoylglutamase [Chitinophagales bacterium]MDW8393515.1 formimidoylglutamase [Chitinophagales bacterium]
MAQWLQGCCYIYFIASRIMLEEFLQQPDDSLYEASYSESQLGAYLIAPAQAANLADPMDAALIGIKEDRASKRNAGSAAAPDDIRQQLFQLMRLDPSVRLADLGNIQPGATLKDTYIAVRQVCEELLRRRIIPILIGGSHDLTFAQYLAHQCLNQPVQACLVDSSIDFFDGEDPINDENFVGRIMVTEPTVLSSLSVLGYQTHLTTPESLAVLDRLHYEHYRLGRLRADISEMEPVLRSATLVSMDMAAVRVGDSPANYLASPNGLFGEEACQLAYYAGQSNEVRSFGLYGCNLVYDRNEQSLRLAAQIIWYFLEGLATRRTDFPKAGDANYLKYTVQFTNHGYELTFWKSRHTDRWWMEVPVGTSRRNSRKFELVACSYRDYQAAVREELPDRWLKAHARMS